MNITLKRKEVQVDNFVEPKFVNVIEFASKELGYNAIQTTKNLPLAKALNVAGIKPFTNESVGKYKKRKIRAVETFKTKLYIFTILGILGVAIGINLFYWNRVDAVARVNLLGGSTTGSLMVGFLSCMAISFFIKNKVGSWKLESLRGYTKEIPSFALETCQEIKQRYPDAGFAIDEFIVEEERKLILNDPFLIVHHEKEKYYIEVWDEPSFKGKKIA